MQTYPDNLRQHVATVLRAYFESSGGRYHPSLVSGLSVTGAMMDRASTLSMRMRTCPVCQGSRTQVISHVKRVIEIDCWRCFGAGEIGEPRKNTIQDSTFRCNACKGSGAVQRREFRAAGEFDCWAEECAQCGGHGYHYGLSVLCGSGEYPHAVPIPGEPASAVGTVLRAMREAGYDDSTVALEVAYGDVGKHVERNLHAPVAVALWPHTSPGKRLMRMLRLAPGKPPHAALAKALHSETTVIATMASLANTAAIATLEQALARFYAADLAAGGVVGRIARKVESAT